ncbi:MAG: peptide chain release factor N(5)-glutamine methyltransferase [Loktanella sp.]|nr:peptide chain release factor N(5)-glutamine methyltransferase [Loktanella sp.]
MVTAAAWFAAATARLQQAGCADAAFDARCLLEDVGGQPRGRLPGEDGLCAETLSRLEEALAQREAGRPLQYILGEWAFLTLSLRVGEGVLIPRPDTECLCEEAASRLRPGARVLDLCAGSGCVGLGVASLCSGVSVTAVELSQQALPYLQENVRRYPAYGVQVRQADVLRDYASFEDGWDAIVSNPPYIPTGDISTLMREVQQEPRMALDGDADGLLFYRVIANRWCNKLQPGGFCAVEVGIGQASAVRDLFVAAGLRDICIRCDLAGIERVVCAVR